MRGVVGGRGEGCGALHESVAQWDNRLQRIDSLQACARAQGADEPKRKGLHPKQDKKKDKNNNNNNNNNTKTPKKFTFSEVFGDLLLNEIRKLPPVLETAHRKHKNGDRRGNKNK